MQASRPASGLSLVSGLLSITTRRHMPGSPAANSRALRSRVSIPESSGGARFDSGPEHTGTGAEQSVAEEGAAAEAEEDSDSDVYVVERIVASRRRRGAGRVPPVRVPRPRRGL